MGGNGKAPLVQTKVTTHHGPWRRGISAGVRLRLDRAHIRQEVGVGAGLAEFIDQQLHRLHRRIVGRDSWTNRLTEDVGCARPHCSLAQLLHFGHGGIPVTQFFDRYLHIVDSIPIQIRQCRPREVPGRYPTG